VNWSDTFVELDVASHDRESFDCGEDELNDFIRTKASKHMLVGISRTMLLPAATPLASGKLPICAFYTIAPASIARETFPKELAKRLPFYPIPVFLIAQLAVHSECHGQGLGKITLIKALEHLYKVNDHMKAFAIIVDCLNGAAEKFYSKYGFEILCQHNGRTRMFLPMKAVSRLFENT
jgi:ribosomal protein S18 acetylase RimI-like enzyme